MIRLSSTTASGLAISTDLSFDVVIELLFFVTFFTCSLIGASLVKFLSNGITLGTNTGIVSDVGLSGGAGVGEAEWDGFDGSGSSGVVAVIIGLVSGMIGISFVGKGDSIASIVIGGDDGVSWEKLLLIDPELKDINGIIWGLFERFRFRLFWFGGIGVTGLFDAGATRCCWWLPFINDFELSFFDGLLPFRGEFDELDSLEYRGDMLPE